MDLVFYLSLTALLIVCALMILLVLMQKPKQEGLGAAFGGGMTNEMFGAHTVTVLQKSTAVLAVSFFLLLCLTAWSGSAIEAAKNDTQGDDLGLDEYQGVANTPGLAAPEAGVETVPSAGDPPTALLAGGTEGESAEADAETAATEATEATSSSEESATEESAPEAAPTAP